MPGVALVALALVSPCLASGDAALADRITIRGRLLAEGGEPVEGARLTLSDPYESPVRDDVDSPPLSPTASDSDGTFSIACDSSDRIRILLAARKDGYAAARWEWREWELTQDLDLGDTVLVRTGVLAGRLVDATGEPLNSDWKIATSPAEEWNHPSSATAAARIRIDARTGGFRLEGLPAIPLKLEAHAPGWMRLDGPVVRIRGGETVTVGIQSDATNTVGGVQVRTTYGTGDTEDRPVFRLVGPDGQVHDYTVRFREDGPKLFLDLPLGEYTLRLDDPRFLPWEERTVHPGDLVETRIDGSAALQLVVFERDTGEQIDEYQATLFAEDGVDARRWELSIRKPAPEGEHVFPGIVPGDYVLLVDAPPHPRKHLRVEGLEAGETQRIGVHVGGGPLLRGTVRDAAGNPVPGAWIELVEPGRSVDSPSHWFAKKRSETGDGERSLWMAQTRTGESGEFLFDGFPPAQYQLRFDAPWALGASKENALEHGPLLVRDDEILDGLELTVPSAFGSVSGKIVWPEGVDTPQGRITAYVGDSLTRASSDYLRPGENEFHLEHLPVGRVLLRLYLMSGRITLPSGKVKSGMRGHRDLGHVEVRAGEESTVELDGSAVLPGTVRLDVHTGERPLPGTEIRLIGTGENEGGRVHAVTDSSGEALCRPVFPGRWSVVARSEDDDWEYLHPVLVALDPGEEAVCDLDIQRREGTLLVLDSRTDVPWHAMDLELAPHLGPTPKHRSEDWNQVRTDDTGELTLRLPPGRYWLRRSRSSPGSGQGGSEPAVVVWGAAGPATSVIILR